MPLLAAADALPVRPQRILVAGTSGAGKTTVSIRIADVLGLEHVEIDALYHGAGWTPREDFLADVDSFSSRAGWVTEWQYSSARPLLVERADLLVWLDLPRWLVMSRVVRRTLSRRLRRRELWNGNIEPPLRTIFTDRDHIVRWAWRTHVRTAVHITSATDQRPELPVVRLVNRQQVESWLAGPLAAVGRP